MAIIIKPKGFSLIELLIALSIMALFSSFAIKGYESYRQNSEKVQAKQYMLQILQLQNQYYNHYFSYAQQLEDLDIESQLDFWHFALHPCAENYDMCFMIQAKHSKRDHSLQLDNSGNFIDLD